MSTAIVQLNVTQVSAPAPSLFQQTGAIISQGATTLAAQTRQLLTSAADLTSILATALAITSLAWSGGVVTATTTAPHGIPNGHIVPLTIAGASPTGYNGTYNCTSTGASTFTYPLAGNPGAETVPGTYIPADVAELVSQVATFFGQGATLSVYVLELGLDSASAGVTALNTYMGNNPIPQVGSHYAYLVPKEWAAESTFFTFMAAFETAASKVYFFSTATTGNYTSFTSAMKCANVMIPSPDAPTTEFSHASDFFKYLNYKPSASNKITPFCFSDLFGVTPYPLAGNGALFDTLLAAGVNIILTGAEGGLTDTILRNGTMMDGRDGQYWYSVDWTQLTVDRDLSAAVIQGSNDPTNPLYYDQRGINRLQAVIGNTIGRGVSFGMIFGSPVQVSMLPADFANAVNNGDFAGQTPINAYPFAQYVAANPSDFAAGIYSGFQFAFSPNRGFKKIIIGVQVRDIPLS